MLVQPVNANGTGYSNETRNGLVSIIKVHVCETPRIYPLLIPYYDDDDWGFRGSEEKRHCLNHVVGDHRIYNVIIK